MASCQLVFLVVMVMVATHGVSGQLRGLNFGANNRPRGANSDVGSRRRPRRDILRDLPRKNDNLRDPSQKNDARVQREELMRHLREKILTSEDGHTKQRLRSQLAFLYELPMDDVDEEEIKSMMAKITADDRNKHDHQRLVRELAKFIKRSKRRHRIQAVPHFVPHIPEPKIDGKAIEEALRKHTQKVLGALKPKKKGKDRSMPSNMHGTLPGDLFKLKRRPVFNVKPILPSWSKIKADMAGSEKKKRPVMHKPFAFPQDALEAVQKHARALEEKKKTAVREAIESVQKYARVQEEKKNAGTPQIPIHEAIEHARRLSVQEEKQELKMEMKQMTELRKKIAKAADFVKRRMLKEKMRTLNHMIHGHRRALEQAMNIPAMGEGIPG